VKIVRWDGEKNEWLKASRHVGFEQAALHIDAGDILDVVERRNKKA
jgi:hypothetical protein